jgi:quinolinate synthase
VLEWALDRATPGGKSNDRKIMFLPDQHLGRNTAYAMGWPYESMVVWDPREELGGLSKDAIRAARYILWKGHCSVHQLFTARQVDEIRRTDPETRIIVHPECDASVVAKADFVGSTEYIINTIETAPIGSKWAVGTEIHLVNRLAARLADRVAVRSLSGIQCLCTTMYRIDLKHLLWVLDNLVEGRVVNQIKVDPETRALARIALDRMLSLKAKPLVAAALTD